MLGFFQEFFQGEISIVIPIFVLYSDQVLKGGATALGGPVDESQVCWGLEGGGGGEGGETINLKALFNV